MVFYPEGIFLVLLKSHFAVILALDMLGPCSLSPSLPLSLPLSLSLSLHLSPLPLSLHSLYDEFIFNLSVRSPSKNRTKHDKKVEDWSRQDKDRITHGTTGQGETGKDESRQVKDKK